MILYQLDKNLIHLLTLIKSGRDSHKLKPGSSRGPGEGRYTDTGGLRTADTTNNRYFFLLRVMEF